MPSKRPVIFHFQPDEFRQMDTPEKIKQWEKLMKERVGFSAEFTNFSGTGTESCCQGTPDDCDQD